MTDLRADCLRTLAGWAAPHATQSRLRDDFVAHLDRHCDGWSRECAGAHLTASSLICSSDGEQVLLVLHKRLGRWLQTGGHIEPDDDSLVAAALREAREESGLSDLQVIPQIAHLDRHAVPCGPVRPTYHLDVRYVIVSDPRHTPLLSAESEQVRWFETNRMPAVDDSVRALVEAARQLLRSRRG